MDLTHSLGEKNNGQRLRWRRKTHQRQPHHHMRDEMMMKCCSEDARHTWMKDNKRLTYKLPALPHLALMAAAEARKKLVKHLVEHHLTRSEA